MPVAVTGIGLFVSGHTDVDVLFNTLAAGRSVIRFDKLMQTLGVARIASGALEENQVEWLDQNYPGISDDATSIAGKMLFHSTIQAIREAGLEDIDFTSRHGMFIGINKNLITLQQLYSMLARYDIEASRLMPQPHWQHQRPDLLRPDQAVEPLVKHLNFTGTVQVHGDACVAGAAAIISGYRRIVSGEIDMAICGATEQASQPIMQLMFSQLGALAQKSFDHAELVSRAFDKDRNGCILSDGSAVLILEDADHARARNAEVIAYIAGVSRCSEAVQIVSTLPSGERYAQCMQMALQDAGLAPGAIEHINAHGTSTVLNDAAESRAIYSIFNTKPSVTATKSALGHALAASGVVELALCAQSIKKQQVLPSLNFEEPGFQEPHLNIVHQSRPEPLNYILSNSFGFGGENCSIVMAREQN